MAQIYAIYSSSRFIAMRAVSAADLESYKYCHGIPQALNKFHATHNSSASKQRSVPTEMEYLDKILGYI